MISQYEGNFHLSGVVDFEMVRFSHKFSDFVLLYVSYFLVHKKLEKSFLRGYGIFPKPRERRLIAFFILQYALELCGLLKEIHPHNKEEGEKIIAQVFSWLKSGE